MYVTDLTGIFGQFVWMEINTFECGFEGKCSGKSILLTNCFSELKLIKKM